MLVNQENVVREFGGDSARFVRWGRAERVRNTARRKQLMAHTLY